MMNAAANATVNTTKFTPKKVKEIPSTNSTVETMMSTAINTTDTATKNATQTVREVPPISSTIKTVASTTANTTTTATETTAQTVKKVSSTNSTIEKLIRTGVTGVIFRFLFGGPLSSAILRLLARAFTLMSIAANATATVAKPATQTVKIATDTTSQTVKMAKNSCTDEKTLIPSGVVTGANIGFLFGGSLLSTVLGFLARIFTIMSAAANGTAVATCTTEPIGQTLKKVPYATKSSKETMIQSGVKGAMLGYRFGGLLLSVLLGFFGAYASHKISKVGGYARALAAFGALLEDTSEALNEKYHIAERITKAAARAWGQAKKYDSKYNLLDKTKDVVLFAWVLLLTLIHEQGLPNRGGAGVSGKGLECVAKTIGADGNKNVSHSKKED